MVSLTGDPRRKPPTIDEMLAQLGNTRPDGSFEPNLDDIQLAADRIAIKPKERPLPVEGLVEPVVKGAWELLCSVRNSPSSAAAVLDRERKAKHVANNMLEFQFEGELAHMKTSEGVSATNEAIKELQNASSISSLVSYFIASSFYISF